MWHKQLYQQKSSIKKTDFKFYGVVKFVKSKQARWSSVNGIPCTQSHLFHSPPACLLYVCILYVSGVFTKLFILEITVICLRTSNKETIL